MPARALPLLPLLLVLLGAGGRRAGAEPPPLDATRVATLLAATAADPGALDPAPRVEADGRRATLSFSAGGAACALRLFPIGEAGPADMSSASLGLHREGAEGGPCGELVSRAVNRIQAHDVAARRTGPAPPPPPPTGLLLLGALLLALLPLGLAVAVAALRPAERGLALLLALVALVPRALAPHRLVMVYFGYKHVGEAVDLSTLPRYGPGAPLLWFALFRATAPDHAAVLWLHAGIGALTVGLWGAFSARVSGSRRAGALTGVVLSFTPLFVRDHVSESMAVPAMLAFAAAAVVIADLVPRLAPPPPAARPPLGGRGVVQLAAVVTLSLYGASCRPDLALLSAPMVAAFALAAGTPRQAGRAALRAAPFIALAAALAVPLVAYGVAQTRSDVALGNLPRLATLLHDLPRDLRTQSVLLLPWAFPVLLWVPVAAAVLRPRFRVAALALLSAALLALVPGFVDFNETSILRLQIPAASLFVLAAGLGFAAIDGFQAIPSTGPGPGRPPARGRRAALLVLGLIGLSMTTSVRPLFTARNPDVEEGLIRESVAAIGRDRAGRPGPATLGRFDHGDADLRDVHLFFPDYLLAARGVGTASLTELGDRRAPPPGTRYALVSLRCYLWPAWQPPPRGEHDACRAICNQHRCQPLFERDVDNLHDWPTFDGYDGSNKLRVGLYRLDDEPAAGR